MALNLPESPPRPSNSRALSPRSRILYLHPGTTGTEDRRVDQQLPRGNVGTFRREPDLDEFLVGLEHVVDQVEVDDVRLQAVVQVPEERRLPRALAADDQLRCWAAALATVPVTRK